MSRFMRSVFVVSLFMAVIGVATAQGQATISSSASQTVVTRTGHTELIGQITFNVVSGTTAAGEIEVNIGPVRITNSATSGITVSGFASLGAVVPDFGIIKLSIPAGVTAGQTAMLSGVRVSAAADSVTTLDARLSSKGNSLSIPTKVRVVNDGVDGIVVDSTSDSAFTFSSAGLLINPLEAFIFREGAANTFSSAIGMFGQTTATRLVFKVSGLQDNVKLTFPGSIASSVGATLITESGMDEVIAAKNDTVVYIFSDSLTSRSVVDTFSVTPVLTTTGAPGAGTAFLQVGLSPIGAVVPNEQFPSSAIPRYDERFVPTSPLGPVFTRTLSFTVSPDAANAQFAVSNASTGNATITFRAKDETGALSTGTDVNSEVSMPLPSRRTSTLDLKQIFGAGASSANVALVEVQSGNPQFVTTSLTSTSAGTTAIHPISEASQFMLPFDRRSAADVPSISIHNPNFDSVPVSIVLRTNTGESLGLIQRSIAAKGTLRGSLTTLFDLQAGALPLSGYVQLTSRDLPVRGSLLNNPASEVSETPAGVPSDQARRVFPFFAFGGGWDTVVSVMNAMSGTTARITISIVRVDGTAFPGVSPVVRQVSALNRSDFDLGLLFGSSSGPPTNGSIVVSVASPSNDPLAPIPLVAGIVRVRSDRASAAAPLEISSANELFLTPTGESNSEYTGVAILNAGESNTNVTVQVFSSDGSSLGSASFTLAPGALRAQLLRDFAPDSLPHNSGLVRVVSASQPLYVLGFRAPLSGTQLLHLRGQTIP